MSDVLFWTEVVLIFGGIVICLGGLIWHKSAGLLEYFGKDAKSGTGLKTALIGLAMLVVGFGLVYLGKQ